MWIREGLENSLANINLKHSLLTALVPARPWSSFWGLSAVDDTAVRQSLDAGACARPVGGEAGLDGWRWRRGCGGRHHSRGSEFAPRNELCVVRHANNYPHRNAGKDADCDYRRNDIFELLLHETLLGGSDTVGEAGFLLG